MATTMHVVERKDSGQHRNPPDRADGTLHSHHPTPRERAPHDVILIGVLLIRPCSCFRLRDLGLRASRDEVYMSKGYTLSTEWISTF